MAIDSTSVGDATVRACQRARVAKPPLLGDGLVSRRVVVDVADAVLVKAVVEAYEGVANVFGEEHGVLVIAAPADREAELDALLEDLRALVRLRHG